MQFFSSQNQLLLDLGLRASGFLLQIVCKP